MERKPQNSSARLRGGVLAFFLHDYTGGMPLLLGCVLACFIGFAGAQPLPIFDAHMHYSHDAVGQRCRRAGRDRASCARRA